MYHQNKGNCYKNHEINYFQLYVFVTQLRYCTTCCGKLRRAQRGSSLPTALTLKEKTLTSKQYIRMY